MHQLHALPCCSRFYKINVFRAKKEVHDFFSARVLVPRHYSGGIPLVLVCSYLGIIVVVFLFCSCART